jgi:hypothetical protein
MYEGNSLLGKKKNTLFEPCKAHYAKVILSDEVSEFARTDKTLEEFSSTMNDLYANEKLFQKP